MKYIYFYAFDDNDIYTVEFDSKEDAIKYGDEDWSTFTRREKKECQDCYILESINPDEEAENHYDGDYVRIYKNEKGFAFLDNNLMDTIASYMDDDIREDLHEKLAPCDNIDFLKAYVEKDPEFEEFLRRDFENIYDQLH